MNKVYVVDHGVGNTVAIMNLLRKMGYSAEKVKSSSQLSGVDFSKSKFILPGVGSFDAGMNALHERGLSKLLVEHGNSGGHILGICLGMQLLLDSSQEGAVSGLGIIPGSLVRMTSSAGYRVPHVGWETIEISKPDAIFAGVSKSRFYHNHSYALPSPSAFELASIDYSDRFAVAIRLDNIVGVQFHPEKSHSEGRRIFINYLSN
jgi:imidazole glycerol phosphate synthase glutamine amidotransferase subunit